MEPEPFSLPVYNESLLEFLRERRSNSAKAMSEPGPDEGILQDILSIAARVPDHRKLAPWRFIVFQNESREKFGLTLGEVFQQKNPAMPEDRVQFERDRFLRAPIVVGVVSGLVACTRGTPEWEQRLSSAIVCYNLCLAAQAHGFGAQWLTEWYSYDADIDDVLGLDRDEKMAGFIYMGTATEPSLPRKRPSLENKISHYL